MQVAAGRQRYNNIDQQAAQAGGGAAYQQLDCGSYSSTILVGQWEDEGCFFECTNRQLAKQGLWPSGVISAVVLLANSDWAITNGSPFTTEDVILVGPGSEYESFNRADHKVAVFHSHLESKTTFPLHRLASQQAGRIRKVADPELARQFQNLAVNVLRSWDEGTQSLSIPQSALQRLMFELLTSPGAANGSSHPSIHLYRAARDVMLDALGEPLTMSEIASRVGTSRRALEHAFNKCATVSPARFHKLLRLNNARRLLEFGQHTVSRAAANSGLHHQGRFSADYHDLFGELPSQTAKRARVLVTDPDRLAARF